MRRTRGVVLAVLAVALSGCVSFEVVPTKRPAATGAPCPTLGVVYSRSFFQERFMGKSIWTAVVFGPLIGAAVWETTGGHEKRKGERLASSEFEKLLDDLDVNVEVNGQFKRQIPQVGGMSITLTEDPAVAQALIEMVRDGGAAGAPPEPHGCAAAFKLAYGIGARTGAEQIGFRKWYRPFIRVVGRVQRVRPTRETLWSDWLLVFGRKAYLGGDADADRVPRAELVSAFRELSVEVVDLLIKSLNGQLIPERPALADTTQKDYEF